MPAPNTCRNGQQAIQGRGQRHGPVARIAGEQFVAAVAGQRHGDVLPRQLRDVPGGNRRAVGERFVIMPDQLRQDLPRRRASPGTRGARSPNARRPGGRSASRRTPAPGNRSRRSSAAGSKFAGHQADDQRRIDAAGQERAERHVALQPQADGRFQRLPQPLDRLRFRQRSSRR